MDVAYSNGYYYLFQWDRVKGIYRYKEGSKEGMKLVRKLNSFSLIGRVIRVDVDSGNILLLNDDCRRLVCYDTLLEQEVLIKQVQVPGTDPSGNARVVKDHQAAPRSRVLILNSLGTIFCFKYNIQKEKSSSSATLLSNYKAQVDLGRSYSFSTLSVCEKGEIVSVHLEDGRKALAQLFLALRPGGFENQLVIDLKKKGVYYYFQGASFHSYVRKGVVIFSGVELSDSTEEGSRIFTVFYQTKNKKVLTSRVFERLKTRNSCVLRRVPGTLSLLGVGMKGIPYKVL